MLHSKDFKTTEEFNAYIEHVAELSKFFNLDYRYVREMDLDEIEALLLVQTNYVKAVNAQHAVVKEHQVLNEAIESKAEAIKQEDYLE